MRAMVTRKPKQNVVHGAFRGHFARAVKSLLVFAVLFVSSCGGSMFKVRPTSELRPMPATAASANLGSISFRAAPLLADEESQELFESNLHLAGLLPVRMEVVHNSGAPVELKKVRFHL